MRIVLGFLRGMQEVLQSSHMTEDPNAHKNWEWSEKNADWHFDTHAQTEDLINLGRFIGDWGDELEKIDAYADKPGILHPRYPLAKDWHSWGYPKALVNYMVKYDVPERFTKLGEHLNLEFQEFKIQSQLPGQVTPLHVDNHASFFRKYNLDDLPPNPKVIKAVVALNDWDWGQYFFVGTQVWHQWKKGDIVTWDESIPHATANAGKSVRHLLMITGVTSKDTKNILKGTEKEISV